MTINEWLNDNQLGVDIWNKKYRHGDETFDEWLDRVSNKDEKVKEIILNKKFLFGGRTLSNRGTGKKSSFSNCYSRGFVDDDLTDLMQAATDIALTFKSQGGQGISLSKIRPKGAGINDGQFKSDGIIPFMEIYNRTTESISQGGSRKGALLMSLDIWHKEAEEFIKVKSSQGKIEKANLSLEIDDEFMEYIKLYYQTGEIKTKEIHRIYDNNEVVYTVTPIYLYKLMMEKAYDWGEPGCIFTNRFRNYNMMQFHDAYRIETCNPCGEQPLPKHGACNLGSVNLSEFVKKPFTEDAFFDFEDFKKTVEIAVEALDVVLDENIPNHPLPQQRDIAINYRNIGLGIMGMHDCLIKLGVIYGSTKSKRIMEDIMSCMFRTAVLKSSDLAIQKGAFPLYDECVLDSEIITSHFDESEIENMRHYGLRNCSLLSIAPSGSIGTMLNISTGCEPNFRFSYTRKTESLKGQDEYYEVYAGIAQEYLKKTGDNSILPEYFVTSEEIPWKDRIDIQAILQHGVDTGISSTINLPNQTTVEEIEKLYLYAWERGLKGITVFRDGCKRTGILTTGDTGNSTQSVVEYDSIEPISRKKIGVTSGKTYCKKCACGTLYITVNCDNNNNIVETFIHTSKGGICQANIGAITRMVSVALRSGVKVEEIADQLKGITCPACIKLMGKGKTIDGISCPDILSKTIMDFYKNNIGIAELREDTTAYNTESEKNNTKEVCPDCGVAVFHSDGCIQCPECGWSKCG